MNMALEDFTCRNLEGSLCDHRSSHHRIKCSIIITAIELNGTEGRNPYFTPGDMSAWEPHLFLLFNRSVVSSSLQPMD